MVINLLQKSHNNIQSFNFIYSVLNFSQVVCIIIIDYSLLFSYLWKKWYKALYISLSNSLLWLTLRIPYAVL